MSKKPLLIVSLLLGIIGIGGAILAFFLGSDNGLGLEMSLLIVGVLSLVLGAVISRQDR